MSVLKLLLLLKHLLRVVTLLMSQLFIEDAPAKLVVLSKADINEEQFDKLGELVAVKPRSVQP